MNRRGFFKGMLAAACTAVARAYVPAALSVAVSEPPKIVFRDFVRAMQEHMERLLIYGTSTFKITVDNDFVFEHPQVWKGGTETAYGRGPWQDTDANIAALG